MTSEIHGIKVGFNWKKFLKYVFIVILCASLAPFLIYLVMGTKSWRLVFHSAIVSYISFFLGTFFWFLWPLMEVFRARSYILVEAEVKTSYDEEVRRNRYSYTVYFPLIKFTIDGVDYLQIAERIRSTQPYIPGGKLLVFVEPKEKQKCFSLTKSKFLELKS